MTSLTQPDVIIVGAGPSGSTAARVLAESGFSVTVLEQGTWPNPLDFAGARIDRDFLTQSSWSPNPNTRRAPVDYPCVVDDADIHPLMYNGVGGSSVMFGAEWPRMIPSDFNVRTLDGVADDWPVDYEDLAPFYDMVDEMIGVSGLAGDPAYPPHEADLQPPLPIGKVGRIAAEGMNKLGYHWWPGPHAILTKPLKGRGVCTRWGVCASGCPEDAKSSFDLAMWPAALAAGVNLVTGARVREITVNDHGLATGVVWIDEQRVEHHLAAPMVIVCANAIGTARLLQMSVSAQHPNGLANSSGLVGKRLMMHPMISVFGVYEENLESWLGPNGHPILSMQFAETDTARGFRRGAKWTISPVHGPTDILFRYNGLPLQQRSGQAGIDLVARAIGRCFEWTASVEDLPDDQNRIDLDTAVTDNFGLPAARITYRVSDETKAALQWNSQRLVEVHEASGAIETRHVDWLPSAGWHMMGTARCGDDPATSVVDGYGRSHDVPNLFVFDASVFVTGSAVNPTPTLSAFAARAAFHLAENSAQQPVPI